MEHMMSKATHVSQKRLPKIQEPPATSVTAFQGITRSARQRSETASDSTNQLVTLARRWRNRRTARHTSALPTSVPSTSAPSTHPVRARSARGPPPTAASPIGAFCPRVRTALGALPRRKSWPRPLEPSVAPVGVTLPEGRRDPRQPAPSAGGRGRPRGHLQPPPAPPASVSPAAAVRAASGLLTAPAARG